MAGTKINEATLREALKGTENIPIVDTDLPKGRTTLANLKEYVNPESITVDSELNTESTNPVQNKVIAGKVKEIEDSINQLQQEQEGAWKYALGCWDEEELSPEVAETVGDKGFLAEWHPFLLDTTDNAGKVTHPVGKLKRNNYLRFEDGTFAPTVGITEEQRAQCDVELYLDNTQQQKYCDAGQFNAEDFYNEYGMSQKLYNAAGEEITHILRPWETTETKYTIGVGREDTVYLVDQLKGRSGKVWRGISRSPKPYDGIDASAYPLKPTAIAPCPSCTVGGKTRNFFFLYEGETNCKSANADFVISLIYNLLFELFRGEENNPDSAETVKNYIDNNYMKDVTVEQIARTVYLDRRYLGRIFKQKTGCTVRDYLISVRMENAAKFLRAGYSVTQCANMCGYRDAFNFSKMFKKHFSVSPKHYRKSL